MDKRLRELYYTPQGGYRKYLLKQEAMNVADCYEWYSKLIVRARSLGRLKEFREATASGIVTLRMDVASAENEFIKAANEVFTGAFVKDVFCERYDEAASILDGLEQRVADFLDTTTVVTEDAKLLQKRHHTDKHAVKDPIKAAAAKSAWKRNKVKYKKAIQKFHKSTAGKQFHRNLDRFNQFRRDEVSRFGEDDILMVAKGLSSMQTHLLIEIQGLSSSKAESVIGECSADVAVYRDLFAIFEGLTGAMVEAYFDKDKEAVADILEIVRDYYELGKADA